MFKRLVCSICCTAEPNVTIQIQLFHRSDDQPNTNNKISLESNNLSSKTALGQKKDHFLSPPTNGQNGSTCSVLSAFDLSYYCLYIFLINGDGGVLIDQDLIYISESDSSLPKSVLELRKPNIGYLKVDSNHSNIGSCLYSTSCLMPFQSYSVSYLRINSQNGRIHSLKTSLKFKIAFKAEIQYPIKKPIANAFNQEYTIVFENEPIYEKLSKIKLEDLCVSTTRMHRKGIKSLIDTAPPSIKTFRSSNDFSKITEKNSKFSKNSFFNSTFTESNGQSGNVTNKNSVHENAEMLMARKWSQNNSLNDPKKTPQHRRLQSYVSKESDGMSYHKDAEGSIMMNETFVVNDSRENTDYVKKMCSAIEKGDKGVYLNYPTPMSEQRDVIHSDNISVIEHEDVESRVKPENLKSTTKKTELAGKSNVPFFSLRKAAKNSFFEVQGSNKPVQDSRRAENPYEDEQALKKPHQRLLFSAQDFDGQTAPDMGKKRAFRKILDSDDQENRDSNIIYSQRTPQTDTIAKTPIPKAISSYGLFPTYGPVHCSDPKSKKLEEGQVGDDEPFSTPNRPRNSLTVSTLSDKKFKKSGDFSFNGKIEELFTVGNIHTTSDTESIRVTPRLHNVFGSINSGGTPELKTLLLPGERLYTVEEVGTPSRELSTLGDGNSHFKSFHSKRSHRKNNNNNSMRLKNSDIGIVSETNEDEERNLSLLKFSNIGRESDNLASLGGDLPLEVMIMAKKIEDLGLSYIYEPHECLLRVYDEYDSDFSFVYKWEQETGDKDLAEFFNDIRVALEARSNERANGDEYVYL